MKKIVFVCAFVLSIILQFKISAQSISPQFSELIGREDDQSSPHSFLPPHLLQDKENNKFSVITSTQQTKFEEQKCIDFRLEQTRNDMLQNDCLKKNICTITGAPKTEYVTKKSLLDSVQVAWVAHYTSGLVPSDDKAVAIFVDDSGNVYVTGSSKDSGTSYDYATVKYNSVGVELWTARYNGTGNSSDVAYALAIDISGNVYVTGKSYSSETYYDYATVKYNSTGVEQWIARYNGIGDSNDVAYALAIDKSGNVYITGLSYGSGTGYDYATVKYNSAGVEQWAARYNGAGNSSDYAYALAIDSSGNVYVTGYSWGSGSNYDFATVKYNSVGIEQWTDGYNGPRNYNDYACAIAIDSSGNVYVTGTSQGLTTVDDYATIKYNSVGVRQWTARYNTPGISSDNPTALAIDASGNVYVSGWSNDSALFTDYLTVKYNSDGIEMWAARYNTTGNSHNYAYALAIDGSGNVYVTGASEGSDTDYDYATVKYSSTGVKQWVARYNGEGNSYDNANSLAVDGSGNVYVTGSSNALGSPVYTTIKYIQNPTAVSEVNPDVPEKYFLVQNYPNPFNPVTTINYQIPNDGFVTLKVFDILGKEIANLVNHNKEAGYYTVAFDASKLPSGVYIYKLQSGEFVSSKKMLLIK